MVSKFLSLDSKEAAFPVTDRMIAKGKESSKGTIHRVKRYWKHSGERQAGATRAMPE